MENSHLFVTLQSTKMLRMLVLNNHFLAKIRPAISPDIHDNISKKTKVAEAAATFVFGAGSAGPQLYCHEYPARWPAYFLPENDPSKQAF